MWQSCFNCPRHAGPRAPAVVLSRYDRARDPPPRRLRACHQHGVFRRELTSRSPFSSSPNPLSTAQVRCTALRSLIDLTGIAHKGEPWLPLPRERGGPTARAVGFSASSPAARPEFSVAVLHRLHRQMPPARRPLLYSGPRSRPDHESSHSRTSNFGRPAASSPEPHRRRSTTWRRGKSGPPR